MTVVIETLLRTPNGDFERLADADGYDGDPDHVSGAVVMSLHGTSVLTCAEWDDLDYLWPYLIQALDECLETGAGERYFPDQPILMRVEKLPTGRLLVAATVGDNRRAATANAAEFRTALAAAGTEYFRRRPSLARYHGGSQREASLCSNWLASAPSR